MERKKGCFLPSPLFLLNLHCGQTECVCQPHALPKHTLSSCVLGNTGSQEPALHQLQSSCCPEALCALAAEDHIPLRCGNARCDRSSGFWHPACSLQHWTTLICPFPTSQAISNVFNFWWILSLRISFCGHRWRKSNTLKNECFKKVSVLLLERMDCQ